MAFGGGGFGQQQTQPFGGFGQQQSQPAFGAPAASSPFGAGGSAFGGQTPAFGAPAATGFGASQPAFGASQPAFGASPSFGGSSAFGARPAGTGFGFGSPAPAASPFGASAPAFGASAPAFGAASTPAFGATSTPAFGAPSSPFGMSTPAFGAPASQPAFGGFGAASTPAFGAPASQPAFGGFGAASTPAFGAPASQPAFGASGSTFGGGFGSSPPAASQGTRTAPYTRHQDKDQSGGATAGAAVYYNTITAMPAYANKSVEELRWEDYQAGVKNAAAAPAPTGGGFGAPASQPAFGGFGASPAPAFGASAPAANPFGAPAPASPFGGGFGATSTPAFGAPANSPFGASTPAFGAPSSTPTFGGFGASSTPAFGAASAGSLFGAAGSTSGFGFGTSTPAFGAPSSTPAFGAPASTPTFGGFGASPASSPFGASPASSASPFGTPSPSPFGAPAPTFGAAPSSSPFGGFGASPSASSASTFGGFGTSFGAKPASTPAFGFGATSAPAFGAPAAPASGAFSFSAASTGGFGAAFGAASSTPAFSFSQPASQPASGGFNFGSFGSSFGAPAQSAPAAAPAPAAQPAGVGQAPYGALAPLPSVNVPEPKVGISARPSRGTITTLRPSPLLTLRSTTPRFGAGPAPRSGGTPGASPSNLGIGTGLSPGASPASALLPARENPHRLFIREPPPSTSASPARGSLTPATPVAGSGGGAATPPATAPASARPPTAERGPHGEDATPSAKRSAETSPANGHYDTGSDLLPKLGSLAAAGYSYEPSPRQLQALASSDPDALAAVEGFTLSRRGVGTLRWLVPVDVRGLELDRIASIEQGEVAVYTQCAKPAVGDELNTSCEVTLLNVYRKKGGQVVTDAAAVASFEKRLRRYCAESGAQFVAYKPDGGVWRFRVEHFSRYGVPLDDEEEEEEGERGDGGGAGEGEDAGADGGDKGRRLGAGALAGDSDLDEATVDGEGAGGDDDAMGDADLEDGAVLSEGAFDERVPAAPPSSEALYAARTALPSGRKRGGPARAGRWEDAEEADAGSAEPLQHRLPALLSLQPGQLAAMRDSFFRLGGATAADAASAEAASAVALPGEGELYARLSAQDQQRRAQSAAQQRGRSSAQHNWARPRPALLSGGDGGVESSAPASTVLVAGPSSPTRLRAAAARVTPLVPRPATGPSSVCDAFMLMGRSFRPSFGPGGQLAVPVNASNPAGGPAPVISITRISPLAPVRAADSAPAAVDAQTAPHGRASGRGGMAALRRRTLSALEAHLAMSVQCDAEDGSEEGQRRGKQVQRVKQPLEQPTPRWQLVCSRRQLPDLVQSQLSALGRREGSTTAHAAELWQLVQVLFEHIEGEGEDDGDDASVADAMSVGGDDGAASVLGGDRGRVRLAAFKRRAALSQWLASRASQTVRDAVAAAAAAGGRDALPWALLHLVAGHQLGAAAAVAAAAGDVRLSVLLATAGRHGAQSGDLAKQLQVWHSAGLWRDHFSQPRKLLLAVLSGRMGEAAAALGLDWPRALGLALWYSTPQTEGLAAAVDCYEAALAGPQAVVGVPPPVPPHSDEPAAVVSAAAAGASISAAVASDAQYELLLLAARGVHGAGPRFTARLLRAAGRTDKLLDAVPGWVLASTLRALGELTDEDAAGEPDAVLLRLTLDAVQQLLLMASGREAAAACCWAVYAVLNLAPALAAPPVRTAAARSLLQMTAPHWAGSRWAHEFLTGTLGLPPAWLSLAQALWAGYLGDAGAQLDHLLDAGAAGEAHALFVASVAPGLFLDAAPSSVARLAALVGRLSAAHTTIGPSWASGGGLYDSWCRLYVAVEGRAARLGGWRRDVVAEAVEAGGDAPAAVIEAASLLAQQLVAAGPAVAATAGAQGAQRRAVLARMSADVGQTLARLGGGAAAAATSLLQAGCATLASHQPLLLSGLAAELAVP